MLELQKRINRDQFETWFRGFGIVQADSDEVICSVPNGFLRDFITRNYVDTVNHAVAVAMGNGSKPRVSFATGTDNNTDAPSTPRPGVTEAASQTETAADLVPNETLTFGDLT